MPSDYGDFAWKTSRLWLSPLTYALTRARAYGRDRMPREGGCVLAINHLAWIDIPVVGAQSPRDINYVAKIEVSRLPGFGRFLKWHGIIDVRRGRIFIRNLPALTRKSCACYGVVKRLNDQICRGQIGLAQ